MAKPGPYPELQGSQARACPLLSKCCRVSPTKEKAPRRGVSTFQDQEVLGAEQGGDSLPPSFALPSLSRRGCDRTALALGWGEDRAWSIQQAWGAPRGCTPEPVFLRFIIGKHDILISLCLTLPEKSLSFSPEFPQIPGLALTAT